MCFEKFHQFWAILSNLHKKNLIICSKNSKFSLITYKKFKSLDEKNCWDASFFNFPFFVTYIGNFSYFYRKQLLIIYFCDCFCVNFYLSGRFKPVKGKLLSDWIRQLEKNEHFCDWERQCVKIPKMELYLQLDTTFVQEFHKRKLKLDWPWLQSTSLI